jgi:hypothetical protein
MIAPIFLALNPPLSLRKIGTRKTRCFAFSLGNRDAMKGCND